MRIQNNITAMNAQRNLSNNNNQLSSNLEKLSSGYAINRAADDAAGLAISEKMRAQITGLDTAETNANDGISLVQTAEGALTEVHSMLNRMVELSMKASNGTYSESEREKLQAEVDELLEEIDRIAESTTFNGIPLLSSGDEEMGGSITTTKLTFDNVFENVTGSLKVTADGLDSGAGIYFETVNAKASGDASVTASMNSAGDITITLQGSKDGTQKITEEMINAAVADLLGEEQTVTFSGDLYVGETSNTLPATYEESDYTPTGTFQVSGGAVNTATDATLLNDSGDTTTDGSDSVEEFYFANLDSFVTSINVVEIAAPEGFEWDDTNPENNGYAVLDEDGALTVYLYNEPNAFVSDDDIVAIIKDATLRDDTGRVIDFSAFEFEGESVGNDFYQMSGTAMTSGRNNILTLDTSITETSVGTDGHNNGTVGTSLGVSAQYTGVAAATSASGLLDGSDTVGNLSMNDYTWGNMVAGSSNSNADDIHSTAFVTVTTGKYDESVGKTIEVLVTDPMSGTIEIVLTGAEGDTFTDEEIEDAVREASINGLLDLSGFTFDSGDSIKFEDDSIKYTGSTVSADNTQDFATETTVRTPVEGGGEAKVLMATADEASLDPIIIQVGNSSDEYNRVSINRVPLSTASLFKSTSGALDISSSQDQAVLALDAINSAIDKVSDARSSFGAIQNRLEHTINNLGVAVENMQAAESRVRDVDMAAEMMEYTKNNILVQSAQAMLAQANQVPQGVLQLLQ